MERSERRSQSSPGERGGLRLLHPHRLLRVLPPGLRRGHPGTPPQEKELSARTEKMGRQGEERERTKNTSAGREVQVLRGPVPQLPGPPDHREAQPLQRHRTRTALEKALLRKCIVTVLLRSRVSPVRATPRGPRGSATLELLPACLSRSRRTGRSLFSKQNARQAAPFLRGRSVDGGLRDFPRAAARPPFLDGLPPWTSPRARR